MKLYISELTNKALRIRGGGKGSSTPPPPKFSVNVSFLKEVTKNVYENQYSTRVSLKKTTLLLIGFYQVENIKSEILFNIIKDALGRIDG